MQRLSLFTITYSSIVLVLIFQVLCYCVSHNCHPHTLASPSCRTGAVILLNPKRILWDIISAFNVFLPSLILLLLILVLLIIFFIDIPLWNSLKKSEFSSVALGNVQILKRWTGDSARERWRHWTGLNRITFLKCKTVSVLEAVSLWDLIYSEVWTLTGRHFLLLLLCWPCLVLAVY